MYCRVNERNEIIEVLSGYYPGYKKDLEKNINNASFEQQRMFAIPENEIVEVDDKSLGELKTGSGIYRYIAANGKVQDNPEAVKNEALNKLNALCDEAVSTLTNKYPRCEIETFSAKRYLAMLWKQMTEQDKADAILSDRFALLANEASSLADIKAIDMLVEKIERRVKVYDVHVGMCIRVKNNFAERIRASDGSRETIESILKDLVFPSAE
jgi:hypothetical protein